MVVAGRFAVLVVRVATATAVSSVSTLGRTRFRTLTMGITTDGVAVVVVVAAVIFWVPTTSSLPTGSTVAVVLVVMMSSFRRRRIRR